MYIVDPINRFARRVPTWLVYLLLAAPVPWLLYLGITGGLGREPISRLEHELGEIALKLLIAGLGITPLRRATKVNLLKFRRTLGLMAFFYVVLHLSVWVFLDVQIISQMWADIVKRPYVTIGMAAFVLMIPLALTSNNWAIRELGFGKWRDLHKLTYVIALLAAIHFVWLSRGWQLEPLIHLAIIVFLLGIRIFSVNRQSK